MTKTPTTDLEHLPTSLDRTAPAVEFSSWASIRERYPDGLTEIVGGGPFGWPPGHATDDTDLTRAVLLAYLHPGGDVVRAAADNMLAWLLGEWPGREPGIPPRDIGGATAAGLRRYQQTGDPRMSGAGQGRAGNGSLMRALPTALAVADAQRRADESMGISGITHDDPRCTVACAAYTKSPRRCWRTNRRTRPSTEEKHWPSASATSASSRRSPMVGNCDRRCWPAPGRPSWPMTRPASFWTR
jgi:ADP-ribosylglycohydrolase